MTVNLSWSDKASLLAVAGVNLSVASAGIKKTGQADLVLIQLAKGTITSAVYTQNLFCAAPVIVAKAHQRQTWPRYLLINAGNANAGTGKEGIQSAEACCQHVAMLTGLKTNSVLPFSTGVIGQRLPVANIKQGINKAHQHLAGDHWFDAAHAIMTTDTYPKAVSTQIELDGKIITLTGIAKGSGMICPDMATLLAFIATDANVAQSVLDTMLARALTQSFNRITVDGDTSTNDACVLMATAQAGNNKITDAESFAAQTLYTAIANISCQLAHAVVRDGEGATKFIAIHVVEGLDSKECCQIAYTIAHSPLVKTALFAADPNWGRILAAIGRSGIHNLDISHIAIYIDDICVIEYGEPAKSYTEDEGRRVFNQNELTITIKLGRGKAEDTVLTCDLSYDYVKINAEYRS